MLTVLAWISLAIAPYVGVGYQQSYDVRKTRILNEGGSPNGFQLIFGIRVFH